MQCGCVRSWLLLTINIYYKTNMVVIAPHGCYQCFGETHWILPIKMSHWHVLTCKHSNKHGC